MYVVTNFVVADLLEVVHMVMTNKRTRWSIKCPEAGLRRRSKSYIHTCGLRPVFMSATEATKVIKYYTSWTTNQIRTPSVLSSTSLSLSVSIS